VDAEGPAAVGGEIGVRTILLTDGRLLVPVRGGYEIAEHSETCTCDAGIDYQCLLHFPLTWRLSNGKSLKA
jgi:hypothetical protein